MKKIVAILFALLPCASYAITQDSSFDGQKVFEEFTAIQRSLETHDYSTVQKVCNTTKQSASFCSYALFLSGNLPPGKFINAVPSDKSGFYRLFKYDEILGRELRIRHLENPYGAGIAFVYIDQLCLLSYAFPHNALPALLTMYRYSEGFWGEYLEDELVKLMVYKRFLSEFQALEKRFPKEMGSLRETYERKQAIKLKQRGRSN